MRLEQVIIHGYRSVKETQTLLTGDNTTVLIGANDHGKSNLLGAVQCLNDDHPITIEDRNWDLPDTEEPWIEWHFRLSEEEREHLVDDLSAVAVQPGQDQPVEPGKLGERHRVVFCRRGISQPVTIAPAPTGIPAELGNKLLQNRPRVELFDQPPSVNLQDSIAYPELAGDLVMQGIFRLAGIWDRGQAIFLKNNATSKQLDAASDRLTGALKDRWNQGRDLRWKLKHNFDRIEVEIDDPSVATRYSKPSVRSSGFRTYFLLSMMTLAKTADAPTAPRIFLFDEPGTYLHPHAQIDLQRSLERIAERAQVIYTTHSIFLINKNHPRRNKVISKTKNGTVIDQKPFRRNWKAVRESLGVLFSNNFLIADKTLLVEGPSDVIYILAAMRALKDAGRLDLDMNDLSIVDAGNAENYVAMAKLMLSEGRTVVALVDGDKSGRQQLERLRKAASKELKDKVLMILELPPDKSVEDLFANLELLRQAARAVAEELVRQKIRGFTTATDDWEKCLESIAPTDKSSLGRTLDEVTATWFNPPEKLSKLSVALQYEQLISSDPRELTSEGVEIIQKIQSELGIRGETAAEEGIYEEVQ